MLGKFQTSNTLKFKQVRKMQNNGTACMYRLACAFFKCLVFWCKKGGGAEMQKCSPG